MPARPWIPSFLAMLILAAGPTMAAWPGDPLVNVPLSLAAGEKYDVFAVEDGCGGAIVAWEDERSGSSDIYAQRVDVNGNVLWQEDGIPVCTAADDQSLYHSSTGTTGFHPVLADGEGGAWIVWQDSRAFSLKQRDIYIQRIDADGNVLFNPGGIAVAARPGMEDQPTLCSDGFGGVFVVWQDKTADPVFYDIHGQHVGPDGSLLWNGGVPLPLVVLDWDQDGPSICPDGEGGFYMAWSDSRDDVGDIYAQHVDPEGYELWAPNGIPVAVGSDGQDAVTITLEEEFSPILAWVDRRGGTPDIYAQKLDSGGAALWGANGKVICNAANSQYRPALAGDLAGGAYIAWFDYRVATGFPWDLNIYVQHVYATGVNAWTANGLAVCTAPDAQRDVDVVSDGGGGVYLAWEDNRTGSGQEDIYLQHLRGDGTAYWPQDGLALCTASGNQQRPDLVTGAGGALVAWPDDRDVLYQADIYCDRGLKAEFPLVGINRVLFDFGEPTGVVSDTFQVSNVSVGSVEISEIAVGSPQYGFSVEPSVPTPFSLGPGEEVDVVVFFDPGMWGGDVYDVIYVHHDGPLQSSPLTVDLRGFGTPVSVPESEPAVSWSLRASPNPSSGWVSIEYKSGLYTAGGSSAESGLQQTGVLDQNAGMIRIFNSAGRLLRSLVLDAAGGAGAGPGGVVVWDGRDAQDRPVPSGVYHIRMDLNQGAGGRAGGHASAELSSTVLIVR